MSTHARALFRDQQFTFKVSDMLVISASPMCSVVFCFSLSLHGSESKYLSRQPLASCDPTGCFSPVAFIGKQDVVIIGVC